MNSFVEAGQLLSDRYRLTSLFPEQISHAGATAWSAVDTLLGTSLRLIILDPDAPTTTEALDAARRSSLIDDPHVVRILSVGGDSSASYIATEIPLGTPLSHFLHGTPFPPEQAHALAGEVAAALNSARSRGVRHLQLTPQQVRVGILGEVFIDGLGVDAALAGLHTDSMETSEADRIEARGLSLLLACLLTGRNGGNPEALLRAVSKDGRLPEQVRNVCARELDGVGALSPGDFVRELAPWGVISPGAFPEIAQTSDTPTSEPGASVTAHDGQPSQRSESPSSSTPSALASGSPETPAQAPAKRPPAASGTSRMVDPLSEGAVTPSGMNPAWVGLDQFAEEHPEAIDPSATAIFTAEDFESADSLYAAASSPADGAGQASAAPEAHTPTSSPGSSTPAQSLEEGPGVDGMAPASEGREVGPQPPQAAEPPASEPKVASGQENGAESKDSNPADDSTRTIPVTGQNDAAPGRGTPQPEDASAGPAAAVAAPSGFGATSVLPTAAGDRSDGGRPTVPAEPMPASFAPANPSGVGPQTTPPSSEPRTDAIPAVTVPVNAEGKKLYDPSKVVVTGAAILVTVAGLWGLVTFCAPTNVHQSKPSISTPATREVPSSKASKSTTPSKKETSTRELPLPEMTGITLLNPQAAALDPSNVDQQDSPRTVKNAIDGNPSTKWESWWYSNPNFVGKQGIGLEIKLKEKSKVSSVEIRSNATGGNVQWRNTNSAAPNAGDVVAEGGMSSTTSLKAEKPISTDTVILWFNQLPKDTDGKNQINIADITVK